MFYWGKPQFFGIKSLAANLGNGMGDYTVQQFQEDYPQLGRSPVPASILTQIIQMANSSIQPDKWLDSWRYAVGLYVAHYVTLYLRSCSFGGDTPEQAAASGTLIGVVQSVRLGDASVNYDTTALTAGTENWGDLNATTYGQMLANRAKLIGLGGVLVL